MMNESTKGGDMLVKVKIPDCLWCGQGSPDMELDAKKVRLWIGGRHIQDVFPEMTRDNRELLISGTHPKCWDEMMKED